MEITEGIKNSGKGDENKTIKQVSSLLSKEFSSQNLNSILVQNISEHIVDKLVQMLRIADDPQTIFSIPCKIFSSKYK